MRPSVGHLLEIAWAVGSADQSEPLKVESRLVQLPGDEGIPFQIQSITGIRNSDMASAVSHEDLYRELKGVIGSMDQPLTAVIHYAQFERPFLEEFFRRFEGEMKIPFDIVCSAQISRRIFPSIPSRNIRAIAGFFGSSAGELKRSASHVEATFEIWKELTRELTGKGLLDLGELRAWLREKPSAAKSEKVKEGKYQYRLDKAVRLGMPDKPGIYRMLSKRGEVLYVGKATSLRSRVNSYFRGQKNRDRKTLEMLSQVWDIRITECGTALEAALMETDEIKKLDPPYNISLKSRRHPPVYYARDFTSRGFVQGKDHPLGPFRGMGSLEQSRLLSSLLLARRAPQAFFIDIEEEVLTEGFLLFCRRFFLKPADVMDTRRFLAFGLRELRRQPREREAGIDEETISSDESASPQEIELNPTPEDIAGKFQRLALRAAAEYRRSRILTKLLNARVSWETKAGWRVLETHQGHVGPASAPQPTYERQSHPWADLGLQDYDRMSVLLSELMKYPHRIESTLSVE